MITNLLLETILMLKPSILKNYLFKVMTDLNKLTIQNDFDSEKKYNLHYETVEDINIILNNINLWIRNYNFSMGTSMKKRLLINLKELVKEFGELIENN